MVRDVVDKPAPKQDTRVIANLLHRAALLLAPDEDTRTRLTGELTSARRSSKLGQTDEMALVKRMVHLLDQGVTYGNWIPM